ncbi:PPPDE putative peptidase domain-containing protein [Radiomyces spectabilis]|uniref:PPPDE putative peptidase domain-containing protein n=1 Tax=Radiomyces spectabilis TaxID=64574 RepID=UPI00221FBEA8|nr:PPPDE putative peptidase domain-containing protein [Radiomyces spectabilis]KAI8384884.1 PPPDE putative peptidase domain-containing protein [Radiomyces spectabilis]
MFEAVKNVLAKSGRKTQNANRHQVFVNVYDMLQPSFLTNCGYLLGVGIYHSGVEIGGQEYCFGGHEYEYITGVFAVEAKVGPAELFFKQSIKMGYTHLADDEIAHVLQDISKEFVGTSYNLLTRNCNHFTDELCFRLTGKHAPGWINRAAKLGTMFPCVIPTEWIEPPACEAGATRSSTTPSTSPTAISSPKTPLKVPSFQSTTTTTKSRLHESSYTYSEKKKRSGSSKSSRTSLETRHKSHKHTSTSSSRADSIILVKKASTSVTMDETVGHPPVKEPDSYRPEVIRSATQLSMGASLKEMDLPA